MGPLHQRTSKSACMGALQLMPKEAQVLIESSTSTQSLYSGCTYTKQKLV